MLKRKVNKTGILYMSYSKDFCTRIASDTDRSDFACRDLSNAVEIDAKQFFDQYVGDSLKITDKESNTEIIVNFIFDKDGDFQYFTSDGGVSDGTIFLPEYIDNLVLKVMLLQTWYALTGRPNPGDTVDITIGNFIIATEYGDFGIDEKPWLSMRETVMLPLRTEVRKEIKNELEK